MHAAQAPTHSHQQEPPVLKDKSSKGQQVTQQVQLCADASTASEQQQQQQQPIPDTAGGNKQRLTKLTGIFKAQRGASKQVGSTGGGSLAPQSMQEAVPATSSQL